jgi:hypothetical protein
MDEVHRERYTLKQQWLVAGDDLRTRQRRGGRVALKGFDFQAAHAVNLLSQLLIFEQGLVQVRYEGAQDVDLMFGDGRQVFMQLKDTPQERYSIKSIREILHGFMKDAIDACGNPADLDRLSQLKLEFVLVTTGTVSGLDAVKILNRTHTAAISKLVARKFSYDRNPIVLTNIQLVAAYVLRHLAVRLTPADSAPRDQTLAAMGRLAVFGVASTGIENTINNIRQLLTPPGEYSAADVYLCMSGLPENHPVTGRNGIVALPGINKQPDLEIARKEFRETGRTSWASIYHELDAARDIGSDLQQSIDGSADSAIVVLLTGPSGSGKSTAVKRVAWDLHVSGTALVFEVIDSEKINESTWDDALRIASLARKPAVFVVDDLSNHPRIFEHLARNPSASVKVLASSRMPCVPGSFSLPVFQQQMSPISAPELMRLAKRLDKKPPNEAETVRLTKLLDGRDIFSISLALQGMSLQLLAQRLLSRMVKFSPMLQELFFGICACGMRDQSVPNSVLLRRYAQQSDWTTAIRERILFEVGEDRVRSVHASLAESVLAEAGVDPVAQKLRFLELIDPQIAYERRFGLGLLQDVVRSQQSKLAVGATSLPRFGDAVTEYGDYLDLDRCANIFESLIKAGAIHLTSKREKILQAKQPDRVRTGYDAVLFIRECQAPSEVFEILDRLFLNNDASHGRNVFMRWITNKGRAHPKWHMQAIEQQFEWVRRHGFPHPETLSLINCITHGNPDLRHEDQTRLVNILKTVLEQGVFIEGREWVVVDLLLSKIVESIYTRLRDDTLLAALLDGLETRVDIKLVPSSIELRKGLARAAQLAGSESTRTRTLRIMKRSLDDFESRALIPVARAMLSLLPFDLNEFISEWGRKFNGATLDGAKVLTSQFVEKLEFHGLI